MQTAIQLSLLGSLVALLGYRLRDTVRPEMRARLASMFWHYMWGMFASGLNGAATALLGVVGISVGAGFDPQTVQAPNGQMPAYIFGVTFALKALEYFTRNPLPVTIDGASTPPFSTDAKLATK